MDWTIVQGGLCREGHVQGGQVGFPLLLNKPLAGVKKHGLNDCTRWTEHKLQFHQLSSGDKRFGSVLIHVVCGLAQPSYIMGHI